MVVLGGLSEVMFILMSRTGPGGFAGFLMGTWARADLFPFCLHQSFLLHNQLLWSSTKSPIGGQITDRDVTTFLKSSLRILPSYVLVWVNIDFFFSTNSKFSERSEFMICKIPNLMEDEISRGRFQRGKRSLSSYTLKTMKDGCYGHANMFSFWSFSTSSGCRPNTETSPSSASPRPSAELLVLTWPVIAQTQVHYILNVSL